MAGGGRSDAWGFEGGSNQPPRDRHWSLRRGGAGDTSRGGGGREELSKGCGNQPLKVADPWATHGGATSLRGSVPSGLSSLEDERKEPA